MAAGVPVLSWFPFRFSKHLKETMTLDTLGQGALLLLTAHYYSTLTPPRDTDRTLASITKMPLANWKERRQDFLDLRHEDGTPFFEIVDGGWYSAEIEAEIEDASSKHARRSAHAALASAAKYGKTPPSTPPGKPAARPARAPRPKPAPSNPAPILAAVPGASPEQSPGETQLQTQLTLSSESVNRAKHDDAPKVQNGLAGKEEAYNPLGTSLPETWVPDPLDQECAYSYGMTDDEIKSELLIFHAMNAANGTFSKNWKATWQIFCARFKERKDAKPAKASPRLELTNEPPRPTTANYESALRTWQHSQSVWPRKLLGPEPGQHGCTVPRELMVKYAIDPTTGIYRRPADPHTAATEKAS